MELSYSGESLPKEIEKHIDLLEETLKDVAERKFALAEFKGILDVETAKINSMTKKQWEEMKITNSEGRKAYTTLKLQDLKKDIEEAELMVRVREAHVEVCKRKINYLMLCFEKEDHLECNCDCHEKVHC